MTDTLWTPNSYFGFVPKPYSNDDLFVVPGGTRYHIRNALVTNGHAGSGGWVRMAVNTSTTSVAESDFFLPWTYVPPRETVVLPIDLTMEAGESFHAEQCVEADWQGMWVDQLVAGSSSVDGTSFSTANFDSQSTRPMVLSVVSTHASAAEVPSSITGGHTNTTWTQLQNVLSANGTSRLTQYVGRATSQQTGVGLTFNFSGTMTACLWAVNSVWSGANSIDGGLDAFQAAGTFSDANSSVLYDVVPTRPAAAKLVSCVAPNTSGGTVWSGNWHEISDVTVSTPNTSLFVHWTRSTGDQHGRAVASAEGANRVAAMSNMVGLTSFGPDVARLVVRLSGVSET